MQQRCSKKVNQRPHLEEAQDDWGANARLRLSAVWRSGLVT
jgi:hypothetical protein